MYSKVLRWELFVLNCTNTNGTVKYMRVQISGFWNATQIFAIVLT